MGHNKYIGSSFDDFLEEEGCLEEAERIATKRVVAWQIAQTMQERSISKVEMAARMQTSRSSLNRLLNPEASVTLETLEKAARVLGKKLIVRLEDTQADRRQTGCHA